MESWFVLAILAAVLWGVAAVLAKLSTPRLGVVRVALLIIVVEGAMYFLAFYYLRDNLAIKPVDAIFASASCIVGAVAYVCFFESVMQGQVSIAGTISAAYPALTVVGALVVLSETLTIAQTIGLGAVLGGVIVLSYEPNPGSQYAVPRRSIFFALIAFALWGLWGLTSKIAVARVGPMNILGFYAISSVVVPLAYVSFRAARSGPPKHDGRSWTPWTLGSAGLAANVLGVFVLSLALDDGPASLVIPISSAYPLVMIILAVGLLHEKLRNLHLLALVFVVVGLVLIGVSG